MKSCYDAIVSRWFNYSQTYGKTQRQSATACATTISNCILNSDGQTSIRCQNNSHPIEWVSRVWRHYAKEWNLLNKANM